MKRDALLWIVIAAGIAIAIGILILYMLILRWFWQGPQPKTKPMLHTSVTLLYGAEGSDDSLLVVQKGDSFGYADPTGKIVIAPRYEYARPFFEGLAVVRYHGKYGYINIKGKTAIPFKFYDALDFHNGEAITGVEMTYQNVWWMLYYSVIDKKGNTLRTMNDNDSVFDRQGNLLHDALAQNPDWVKTASEADTNGLKPVKQDYGYLYGYADETGKIVIAPAYLQACPFSEGLACVETDDERWVIIDQAGKEICPLPSGIRTAGAFTEGLCAVGGNFHFAVGRFDWGFVNTTGKLVIDCNYDQVTPFKNGIAEVLLNGKIGYIDKTGKYIWEPK